MRSARTRTWWLSPQGLSCGVFSSLTREYVHIIQPIILALTIRRTLASMTRLGCYSCYSTGERPAKLDGCLFWTPSSFLDWQAAARKRRIGPWLSRKRSSTVSSSRVVTRTPTSRGRFSASLTSRSPSPATRPTMAPKTQIVLKACASRRHLSVATSFFPFSVTSWARPMPRPASGLNWPAKSWILIRRCCRCWPLNAERAKNAA